MLNVLNVEKRSKIISVCGASIIDEEVFQIALELGGVIAKAGYIVACGGLYGTMEAVCRGAKQSGGLTLGVIPSMDKATANSYVDIVIPTGMGDARNAILVSMGDAVVSIAGGAGTLSELAFAWRMNKPIVALTSTGGWSMKLAGYQIDETRSDVIFGTPSPQKAIDYITSLLSKPERL